jgi:hypothetical protein
MFKPKGIRDLFAIASLMPGFRGPLTKLNDRMSETSEGATPEDFKVIAPAHVDRTRYITALMGRRDNLDTQFFGTTAGFRFPSPMAQWHCFRP